MITIYDVLFSLKSKQQTYYMKNNYTIIVHMHSNLVNIDNNT